MRTSAAISIGLIGLICLPLVACGGDSSPTGPEEPPPPEEPEPHHLVFVTQPTDVALGIPFESPIVIEVRDADDRRIPNSSLRIDLSVEGDGTDVTLRGARSVLAAQGIASFPGISLNRGGTFVLRATSGDLSVTSGSFVVEYAFLDIEARFHATCGTTTGGLILCWGVNRGGFGLPDSDALRPVALPASIVALDTFHVGTFSSCGLSAARAYCWGLNYNGELGIGQLTNGRLAPQAVIGGHSFTALAVGQSHTCGLADGGGTYCWGVWQQSLSGDGSDPETNATAPVLLQGGLEFVSLATQGLLTCGLTSEGDAYCWGDKHPGDGTVDRALEPRFVAAGQPFRLLAPGVGHTCGLDMQDRAWCWGDNGIGGIGDGTREARMTPVSIGDIRFRTLSSGDTHTCGVDYDHIAWCWGLNYSGQVGNEEQYFAADVPVRVDGGLRFRTVTVANDYSCGVTLEGDAWCWGDNTGGMLGIGTTDGVSVAPVRVIEPNL